MKKKILSAILCVAMIATMAVGCTTNSQPQAETTRRKDSYKVGISIQSLKNDYWAGVMGKLEDLLKEKGWDYTLQDCTNNSATQISQVENFITSGCDLIMVHPSDADAL